MQIAYELCDILELCKQDAAQRGILGTNEPDAITAKAREDDAGNWICVDVEVRLEEA